VPAFSRSVTERLRKRVVLALSATALSERGWPTLAEDPGAAAERAARSISYITADHSVVVTHCLEEQTAALLRRSFQRHLRRAPVLTAGDARIVERFVDLGCVVLSAGADVEGCNEEVASDLAIELDAEILVLLTDEPVLWDGEPDASSSRAIRRASPRSLEALEIGDAYSATVAAAQRFVRTTGRVAAIGAIDHVEAMIVGEGGTLVLDDGAAARFYGEDLRMA
jgi:carbamate kinase